MKIFLAVILVLFVLLLLVVGAVAYAVAATGLFEVPVLSNLIKPPAITEDFSYQPVSEEQLGKKLESAMGGTKGNITATITLTDDEANTVISDLISKPDSAVKEILLKFSEGVIKVKGTLTKNDAPFYLELKIAKSANTFEFEFQNVQLGALPLPGFLIEGLIGQVLGTGQLLGKPTAESFPVEEVIVREGSIEVKGLDLSGLMPPEE